MTTATDQSSPPSPSDELYQIDGDNFTAKKPKMVFEVRRITKTSWRNFSKFHYLSDNLPGGVVFFYGLFFQGKQIGFQCLANYTPHGDKKKPMILHSNRTVVHPDYVGLGLGIHLINASIVDILSRGNYRVMAKFSSKPVYAAMLKNKRWKFLGAKRTNGTLDGGEMMGSHAKSFRDGGVVTYHFEWLTDKVMDRRQSQVSKSR